jgi:hypothetical protein
MKKIMFKIPVLVLVTFFLAPIQSKCQDTLKLSNSPSVKDAATLSRYLQNIEKNRLYFASLPTSKSPIKLKFKIPQVKVYNTADYYVDGKFSCLPFNSWGRHQVPFHLNQPIFIQVKER